MLIFDCMSHLKGIPGDVTPLTNYAHATVPIWYKYCVWYTVSTIGKCVILYLLQHE